MVDEAIAANPAAWDKFVGGEDKALGTLVGAIMENLPPARPTARPPPPSLRSTPPLAPEDFHKQIVRGRTIQRTKNVCKPRCSRFLVAKSCRNARKMLVEIFGLWGWVGAVGFVHTAFTNGGSPLD